MPNPNDSIPNGPHPIVNPDHIKINDSDTVDPKQQNPDEEETKPEDFEKFNVDNVDQLEKEKKNYNDSE
ncbi:hypothetical protein [Marinilactibacillus psychrotolerans]|uniref:Uncharacterized protein n=2 Tax=Marinilactibacillus psychrotolerans TaxID=191770 RepID=A0A511H2X6_9LACT|nr:hypothetical protein [Marinilactibacillus psychrotolerans]TLQ09202.1 hypothetical protein FEZ48_01815 [Marinilactibacillus psychrotolerans]SDD10307.1 hypothetical protein SAMN04488013_1176 [Marinilactibacillus psychrotolerans]SJN43593.1 hypothetical protein FM115_10100 [Marinilactibacillus psychrotolerans 42ea]GEL67880.1 hypothetical protein MPS01_20350 [Marinilactibacillus psychrotolerans]GEQ36606.1 hypothetical protein M132T_21140 [Marinilactibacillus psychrotolerans]